MLLVMSRRHQWTISSGKVHCKSSRQSLINSSCLSKSLHGSSNITTTSHLFRVSQLLHSTLPFNLSICWQFVSKQAKIFSRAAGLLYLNLIYFNLLYFALLWFAFLCFGLLCFPFLWGNKLLTMC